MPQDNTDNRHASSDNEASNSKRKLLKLMGSGAMAARVPVQWAAPLVTAVALPGHAQSTLNPAPPCRGGKTKSDSTVCCDDVDKTLSIYLDECCDRSARDADGKLVKNAQGEYLCCDVLDPKSREYLSYCCTNQARDSTGGLVKNADGDVVCCEGNDKDPAYCCVIEQVTYSRSIDRTRTNWTTKSGVAGATQLPSITVPQWDPANGPLAEIRIEVTGDIDSEGEFENKDSAKVTATFTARVDLLVEGPNGIVLISHPESNVNKELESGEAGGTNQSGPDYWKVPSVNAIRNETKVIDSQLILQRFYIGNSPIELKMTATGVSSFSSTGANFSTDIDTFAGATISLTYVCSASKT